MRFGLAGLAVCVLLAGLTITPSAQSPALEGVYGAHCGTCHGPGLTGGTGPSILTYIRYHTDPDVAAALAEKHSTLQIPPEELRAVLSDVRALAGTNPTMSTGGYTGQRATRGGGAPAAPAWPTTPVLTTPADQKPTTITMAGGKSRTGVLVGETELDATLFENGRLVLLSRDGDVYREKAIAPKADWLFFRSDTTNNHYSPLTQINTATIQKLAPAWTFAMPGSTNLEMTPTVVDGIMYVAGWNEWHALDATTGMRLWSYSEPRHPGILGNAGFGANRGVTLSGDRAFVVTDHAHLMALDRFTGQKLWEAELASHLDGYSTSSPPLAVGDLMILGVAGGEEGARGFVDAYRASTGERVWRWWAIPKRGEPGSETWIGQALEHGCGPTWIPGSYNPELNLVVLGHRQPLPRLQRR